jgi:rhodanese-related sulfurtransferase
MTESRIASFEDVGKGGSDTAVLVLDVLPPEHYAARHIPGAFNACVYEVTFLEQVDTLTEGDKTVPVPGHRNIESARPYPEGAVSC